MKKIKEKMTVVSADEKVTFYQIRQSTTSIGYDIT